MAEAKPFDVPKRLVWEAYKRVRANRGAAGVDGQSLADFEKDLKSNLYKVWNRMASGSYFPSPVRRVEIPKGTGGTRPLGIPTVGDRIAQTVVKMVLEPIVDPHFHEDSYAYRPGKSALDAVGIARKRCWRADWVIDLDIKGFFDNLDHDLIQRAVAHHTDNPWVRLYITRWLRVPVEMPDGSQVERTRGTPQGGVISPLLANLFMHYAFDVWMRRCFPSIQLERYADDGVPRRHGKESLSTIQRVPCRTRDEGRSLGAALQGEAPNRLGVMPVKSRCGERSRKRPVYRSDGNHGDERKRTVRRSVESVGMTSKLGGVVAQDKSKGNLFTAWMASGIEAA